MNQLLILGAGGHGKVMAETAEAKGVWNKIGLLDDRHAVLDGSLRWPVLEKIEKAARFVSEYSHATVAVGDFRKRLEWLDMLASLGFSIPTLIHPKAWVSPSASLAEGCVVMANATVQADATLGRGCIVNTGASVDHDCSIGDGVHICPGVSLGGDVIVGYGSWLGIGSSVIQGIHIGGHATVGAGAAVISDVSDCLTVVGVPARGISGGME
ncbi:MAG: acetyltransferase [Mariprofundus sp.]|nr:acetyltransferase [Mariprofundus sp.]